MPIQALFRHAQTCEGEGLSAVSVVLIAPGVHDAHSKLHEHQINTCLPSNDVSVCS